MPTITLETLIKAPVNAVFDLSRSIETHQLSVASTHEKAIAGKTSGLMELGDEVTWRGKHFGFYQTLSVKITAMDAPVYFKDEMVKGIFKSFKHEHFFQQIGKETVMKDVFEYQSPLWIFGKIANVLFLKRYMTDFLKMRNEVIKQQAEQLNLKTT